MIAFNQQIPASHDETSRESRAARIGASARFALRAATDDLHGALDRRMSALDLADRNGYASFLSFQARTVPALEIALLSAGLDKLLPGWSDTRRTTALHGDLATLGETIPEPAEFPDIAGEPALLGVAYVLEGSRLGGSVLVRRIGRGFPTQFLSAQAPPIQWPELIALMEQRLYSPSRLGEAKDAARHSFAWFLDKACEAGL